MTYWASLENWTRRECVSAMEASEDKYSFLLLHHPATAYLQPSDLMSVEKNTRLSSLGVDGWTYRELVILPLDAWFDLMIALRVSSNVCRSAKCLTRLHRQMR